MAAPRPTQRSDLEVHLGASGLVVGHLHLGSGRRSAFSYDDGWLQDARFFTLSPDLQPVAGVQHPRQVFFLALEERIDMCRPWWNWRRCSMRPEPWKTERKACGTCATCWGKAPRWVVPDRSPRCAIPMDAWRSANFPARRIGAT